MAKSYAFLCVGYFLEAFHHQGTQDNVVWKAFTNMVRMSPPDSASREAVKQAIDLIVPFLTEGGDAASSTVAADVDGASDVGSLEEIAGGSGTNGKKRPVYVSLVRRVLAEEGPNSPALVTILQMVVRNREAFASSR